jgi:hypothetical protein
MQRRRIRVETLHFLDDGFRDLGGFDLGLDNLNAILFDTFDLGLDNIN